MVQRLIDMFEQLDVKVSKGVEGKTVTMASTTALQDGLAKRVRPLGVRMVRHADHLGVTTAAGRRRRGSAFSKRASKYAARRDRIARIRRTGGRAQTIIRQGKVPSAMYGVPVMGMASSTLAHLRQSVATSFRGNTMGRSTPLVLLAEDADPSIRANTEPLVDWALAWQEVADQPDLRHQLQGEWERWVYRVGRVKTPWLQVRGPAGAFAATIKRLGWITQAAHSITIGEEVLDLRTLPIKELKQRIRRATEDSLKQEWLNKHGEKHDLDCLFVEPVQALLKRAQLAASEALWGRGLTPDPAKEFNLWDLPTMDTSAVEGESIGFVQGDVYTDGSLLYGECLVLRRGGWVFVQLDAEHELRYAMFGPLEGPQSVQSIYKSELVAIAKVLERACPPVRIFSDCKAVIDGFERGPAW
ncbi:unnamed protein product, partial [Prorocentrum cordatum]